MITFPFGISKRLSKKKNACFSCGTVSDEVEAEGIYYCPNAYCHGCGGTWFRRRLKSFVELGDKHTVDQTEWEREALDYILTLKSYKLRTQLLNLPRNKPLLNLLLKTEG